MKLKPLGDRVLVKRAESETKTKSGIFIPDTAQEKTTQGFVVAVGDDEAIKVKPKDKILFDKYAGTEITVDGEDHVIMRNDDIQAIIEE
ncbi:co-chaperone GroES [Marispirochaeta sp.]|jgi:chaperonin GroES|uniref:co-chaperone GroES n=1 Tax=Marispirochaeta sp. TaxID=2038653 RepID=UPI0029C8403E|nr:co-chaperone GroES [Marispirochaeta sp.]